METVGIAELGGQSDYCGEYSHLLVSVLTDYENSSNEMA